MFDKTDTDNLNMAEQLLSEALSFDVKDIDGYNAALFRLKQSLELLGTLRNKGESVQENEFFRRTYHLRNALVHGVAILNNPRHIQQIKKFITEDLSKLKEKLKNLKSSYNLNSTQLYTSIAQTSAISNIKPNMENITLYTEVFNAYLEMLRNIDLNTKDQSFPTRKLAALNAIFVLAEIAKQIRDNIPYKFLEVCKGAEFILSLSGSDRNALAHVQNEMSIKRIQEIQSKLITKPELAKADYGKTTTSIDSNDPDYQRQLQQLAEQIKPAAPPTSKPTAKLKKRSREEEDLLASQKAAMEWEQQQSATPPPQRREQPFKKRQ